MSFVLSGKIQKKFVFNIFSRATLNAINLSSTIMCELREFFLKCVYVHALVDDLIIITKSESKSCCTVIVFVNCYAAIMCEGKGWKVCDYFINFNGLWI